MHSSIVSKIEKSRSYAEEKRAGEHHHIERHLPW